MKDFGICLTGLESHPLDLFKRIRQYPQYLHEWRLDAFEDLDEAVSLAPSLKEIPLVLTLRSTAQGGLFKALNQNLSKARKSVQKILERARPLVLDLDLHFWDFFERERAMVDLPMLSFHDFQGRGKRIFNALWERPAALYKIAVMVRDTWELFELKDLVGHRAMIIGMGQAGLLSRIRYLQFGGHWTYLSVNQPIAPGQLSLTHAQNLPESAHGPFWGIIGGENVSASPGPWIYPSCFATLGLKHAYIPIITRAFKSILPRLVDLGLRGLSVTMPFKEQAYGYCSAQEPTQAINTLKWTRDRTVLGINTDVLGIFNPLSALLKAHEIKSVLILGSGGAARSSIAACQRLQCSIAVAARHPFGLQKWAREQGVLLYPWETRTQLRADLLIQATPLSGSQSAWPLDGPWPFKAVFDLALTPEPSALLAHARRMNAQVLSPMDMWYAQGAAQVQWWLNKPCSPQELKAFENS